VEELPLKKLVYYVYKLDYLFQLALLGRLSSGVHEALYSLIGGVILPRRVSELPNLAGRKEVRLI